MAAARANLSRGLPLFTAPVMASALVREDQPPRLD
jgi:hypothetical protein